MCPGGRLRKAPAGSPGNRAAHRRPRLRVRVALVPHDDDAVRSVSAAIGVRIGAVGAATATTGVRDAIRSVAWRRRVPFWTPRTAATQATSPRQPGLRGRRAATSAPADGGRRAQRHGLAPADRVEPHAVATVARFVSTGRLVPGAVVTGLGLAAATTAGRVVDLISAAMPVTVGARSARSAIGIPTPATTASASRSRVGAAGMATASAAPDRAVLAERRGASVGAARSPCASHATPTDRHDDVRVDGDIGVDHHASRATTPSTEPGAPTAAARDDEDVHRRRRARGPEVPGARRGEHFVRRRYGLVVTR